MVTVGSSLSNHLGLYFTTKRSWQKRFDPSVPATPFASNFARRLPSI